MAESLTRLPSFRMTDREYGRFFFYYTKIMEPNTNDKPRKSISSGYIIPKIIFNEKKCQKRTFLPKTSKSCEKLKILRKAQNPAKPRKSCSPARNPGPQPESAPQPEMPPRTSNPGSQDLKSWTPDARPLQNLGSWHPKTTLCDQFLKKCPAMVKTEAFFFGG